MKEKVRIVQQGNTLCLYKIKERKVYHYWNLKSYSYREITNEIQRHIVENNYEWVKEEKALKLHYANYLFGFERFELQFENDDYQTEHIAGYEAGETSYYIRKFYRLPDSFELVKRTRANIHKTLCVGNEKRAKMLLFKELKKMSLKGLIECL